MKIRLCFYRRQTIRGTYFKTPSFLYLSNSLILIINNKIRYKYISFYRDGGFFKGKNVGSVSLRFAPLMHPLSVKVKAG